MENKNKEMEIMEKVVSLLKAGKADELDAAIQLVTEKEDISVPLCVADIIESLLGVAPEAEDDRNECKKHDHCTCCKCNGCTDEDDDCEDDEDNEEAEPSIYDRLHAAGIHKITDTMIAMPTVYGRALMMLPSAGAAGTIDALVQEALLDMQEDNGYGYILISVDIDGDNIVYDPNVDGKWIMFLEDMKDTGRLVFPIDVEGIVNDHSLGGAVCTSLKDVLFVADSMTNAGMIDFEMPHVAYKVTKPGMQCKDVKYEMDKLYIFDDDPILHKQGIHFADNKATLFNWYRPFDSKNELYRIQVGEHKIENGIGVTDSIMFVEKLNWQNF